VISRQERRSPHSSKPERGSGDVRVFLAGRAGASRGFSRGTERPPEPSPGDRSLVPQASGAPGRSSTAPSRSSFPQFPVTSPALVERSGMPATSLEHLFERYRSQGDLEALASVFDRVAPELLALAAHLVRDPSEAEDLLQSTFVAAIEGARAFDA